MRLVPFLIVVAVCSGLLGAALDRIFTQSMRTSTAAPTTCRPSAPARAADKTDASVVLFWGNSIAFDGAWDLGPSFLSVNCAQQGLRASTALHRTEALPDIQPDAIVLFFGSVELAAEKELPVNFANTVQEIISRLTERYGPTRIILAGIPHGAPAQHRVLQVNKILASISGAHFFDTHASLSDTQQGSSTYDGIHLTSQSYRTLRTRLVELLGK